MQNWEVPSKFETFWAAEEPQVNGGIVQDMKLKGGDARSPAPVMSDGLVSLALDRDIFALIDDISNELSRVTTATSSFTLPETRMSYGSPVSVLGDPSWLLPEAYMAQSARDKNEDVSPRTDGGSNSSRSYINLLQSLSIDNSPTQAAKPAPALDPSSAGDIDPLPQVLHALDDEDDKCIVVVRRITRLGFKSNRILKSRLDQLGLGVKTIVLLPSRSRPVDSAGVTPHARPSSMGFVVFNQAKDAAEALARGSIKADGVDVLIQPFVRQYKPSASIHRSS